MSIPSISQQQLHPQTPVSNQADNRYSLSMPNIGGSVRSFVKTGCFFLIMSQVQPVRANPAICLAECAEMQGNPWLYGACVVVCAAMHIFL